MKYTKCYLSEVGHKNFFYPTSTTALITGECEYSILPWVGGENKKLTPIMIKKTCVIPLNMSPPDSVKGSTVVWVETDLLPLSSVG
tara:strand:+ start:1125 stop:1382 length:258 start_codon:yes stop_codon:yes gene_type:complete